MMTTIRINQNEVVIILVEVVVVVFLYLPSNDPEGKQQIIIA